MRSGLSGDSTGPVVNSGAPPVSCGRSERLPSARRALYGAVARSRAGAYVCHAAGRVAAEVASSTHLQDGRALLVPGTWQKRSLNRVTERDPPVLRWWPGRTGAASGSGGGRQPALRADAMPVSVNTQTSSPGRPGHWERRWPLPPHASTDPVRRTGVLPSPPDLAVWSEKFRAPCDRFGHHRSVIGARQYISHKEPVPP